MLKGLNWAGVIAALIVNEAISYFWYGQLFGAKLHDLMDAGAARPMVYMEAVVLALVMVVGVAWVVRITASDSWVKGAVTGLMLWFLFMLPNALMGWIYMAKSPSALDLLQANVGFELLFFVVAGALTAGVRLPAMRAAAT